MDMASTTQAHSMGHLALHYGKAEDGPLAARLLREFGLVETQMLPLPGGNFYRFVVGDGHFARGDGIVYLSALPEPQVKLIEAIKAALKIGTADEHEAVAGYNAMLQSDPEASFHFGFLVPSLDDLEDMVLRLRALADSDPEFAGRLHIGMNRARKGDAEVDARLDASPVFGDCHRYAYGRNGVQVFVETDIVRSGQLGDRMHFEFDYVFPGHDSHILSVVEF
ncbi:MAG: hypothetical protein KDE15_12160 [Erythrobacter sp.]|nr:hypothetical protein [Erythrobacter sp.]